MNRLKNRHPIWAFAVAVVLTSAAVIPADELAPKVHEVVADKFAKQDRNSDKQLSVTEFQAWHGGANAGVALRDFDLFDRNADGSCRSTSIGLCRHIRSDSAGRCTIR